MALFVFFLVVAAVLMHGEVGATSSSRQEIRQYVLNGYDKSTHPNNNVRLRFSIYYDYRDCPTLDPASGTLLSTVQEKQQWRDGRLTWDPSSFGNVGSIANPDISPGDVWTPGISIDQGNGQQLSAEEIRLSLTSGGVLTRDRKLEISTNCDQILSGGDWKCVLRFASWRYHGENFVLTTFGNVQGRVCTENVTIKEYETRIEEVGGYGNSHQEYVIEMVIESQ